MNWMNLPRAGVLSLSCVLLLAQAQTPPAKPGAPAVKSLGKGSGAGMPMLDKEQLRACFKQRDELEVRLKSAESERGPLDAEKTEITDASAALNGERASVDEAKARVDELSAKFKAFAARVATWNASVKDFNERGGSGAPGQAQRQRDAIANERLLLEETRKQLEAEKEAVTSSAQATVNAFNAKVVAHQQRATSWNERNRAWNEASSQLEAERSDWVVNCADRRYREDDEIAIKAGR
jgi:DNA repair exonuclease SbcCD ATPase subunit